MASKRVYYYRRIKDLRIDNDKTQSYIAKKLGITQQQYSIYENGEREIPVHLLKLLALEYKASLDYITGLVEDSIPLKPIKKELTSKQLALLESYEKNKNLQEAVDKLLDIGD